MEQKQSSHTGKRKTLFNVTTAVVLGQVGFLTLLIVLLAVGAGLWLDGVLSTRPLFTLILVLASIPLSLVLTVKTVKRAIQREKQKLPGKGLNGE
jgi:magnesium-transporting ATPase (P-type)